MHLRRTLLGLICSSLTVAAASTKPNCTTIDNVVITFYGYPDNTPPGPIIAYTCPVTSTPQKRTTDAGTSHENNNGYWGNFEYSSQSQHQCLEGQQCGQPHLFDRRSRKGSIPTAGGTGTYANPVTMASSLAVLNQCAIYYLPYLQKYIIFSDECVQCEEDANSGIIHIDIWTGSTTSNGGKIQINCEDALTPDEKHDLIKNPPSNLPVNSKFYDSFIFQTLTHICLSGPFIR
jgi:hypothetical protein